MNTLVLIPGPSHLLYSFFSKSSPNPILAGSLPNPADNAPVNLRDLVPNVPRLVALRLPFGGELFPAPALVTPEVVSALDRLAPDAPLHIPRALSLIRDCASSFPDCPVVLLFETSFFTSLPEREYLYAIDADSPLGPSPRRFGYHGLFHHAACSNASLRKKGSGVVCAQHPSGLQANDSRPLFHRTQPLRILSICLEPRPEIAAVLGNRPLMVTAGATPLEGLPGQTCSGELDPGIVLTLARSMNWGAEEINAVLTRKSGLLGLTGSRVSLPEVLTSNLPRHKLAGDVMRYRILLASGAAVSALGGLDLILFSGAFAELGSTLGPWLTSHLHLRTSPAPIPFEIYSIPLDRIIADSARSVLARKPRAVSASSAVH